MNENENGMQYFGLDDDRESDGYVIDISGEQDLLALLAMILGPGVNDLPVAQADELAFDEVNGLLVSTVDGPDGIGTALFDGDQALPVERYDSREAALEGHTRWLVTAQTVETVTTIPWPPSWPEAQTINVRRDPSLSRATVTDTVRFD